MVINPRKLLQLAFDLLVLVDYDMNSEYSNFDGGRMYSSTDLKAMKFLFPVA